MEKQEMKEWEIYQLINRIIYDLNEENISQSVQRMFDIFDDNYPYSFNIVTSHGIYTSFVAQIVNSNIIFDFLNELEKMLNENNKMFDVLYHFLAKKYTNEARYLINEILENEYFKPKFFILFTPYFAHYNLNKNLLYNHYKNDEQFKYFFENYEVLSKNDWELHKKLIKEGHNPNEITKIIRNDEIEKLQEISSQTNFDYNQTIEPSLYERCSFINKRDVSLIDYAAFFGSIQCFKYLLMNGSKLENTGKYAVANGNEEIIHLCEQNHSTFKDAYKAAIKFHKNNISKYLYDNRNEDINNLEELGKKCVSYNNLDVFLILHKEGMKINNDIINEFARVGNIFLIKHFLRENEIPKDILVFSSASGNIELVKHILKQEGIDINAKNIYLFYLKFILII